MLILVSLIFVIALNICPTYTHSSPVLFIATLTLQVLYNPLKTAPLTVLSIMCLPLNTDSSSKITLLNITLPEPITFKLSITPLPNRSVSACTKSFTSNFINVFPSVIVKLLKTYLPPTKSTTSISLTCILMLPSSVKLDMVLFLDVPLIKGLTAPPDNTRCVLLLSKPTIDTLSFNVKELVKYLPLGK